MKIYVFEDVEQVSDNYHSGGGLAIVAKDREQVAELVDKEDYIRLSQADWNDVKVYALSSEDTEPRVFVFPDAGCC
ncbi:hypothetical protein [Mesobacillus zeae]|uniref:hypothetical protein n=1 Tax=Mesobacillus zeae TaxID=1917180 RepID=UPI0030096F26